MCAGTFVDTCAGTFVDLLASLCSHVYRHEHVHMCALGMDVFCMCGSGGLSSEELRRLKEVNAVSQANIRL